MATTADLRQRIFDNLYSARLPERPYAEPLGNSYTSVGTLVTVSDGNSWAKGDIIENQITGEQMYIQSMSTNDATVIRGWNNTTVAASSGTDDLVFKNPRITIKQVDDAITNALRELEGHGIHAWATGGFTLVLDTYFYNIPTTDVIDVVSVYYQDDDDVTIQPLPFFFNNNLNTATAAQGHGITVKHWGDRVATETLYYDYKQRIDDVSKLMARQEELVVLASTIRLLGATMAPRTHDPGKHSDRTVQPGQGGRDARLYQTEFIMAVRREAAQLKVEASRQPTSVLAGRSRRWRA